MIEQIDVVGIQTKQLGRVSGRTGTLSIKAQELKRELETLGDSQRYRRMNEGD